MKCMVYTAEEIAEMLNIGRTKSYELLNRAADTCEPFVVLRVDKLLRVPKDSFEAWVKTGGKKAKEE